MWPPDPSAVPERLAGLPHGARLLAALAEPAAPGGVHLVGGAVRDLLLGGAPVELDLVAERDGPAVARALATRLAGDGGSVVQVHERFGTATVALGDGTRVDVATARAERYPRPGALPEVSLPAPLEEDLRRRDFTVNAVAVGVAPDVRGAVHAAAHALGDLAGRRLRVLHDRSFLDDPTRLIRLARYAARLGFAVEEATARLAREAFAAGAPATAGPARIGAELLALLREERALEGLELLADLAGDDALAAVLPPSPGGLVESMPPESSPSTSPPPALARRALALLPADGDRAALILAALAHARGTPPEQLARWLARAHVPEPRRVLDAAADPASLGARVRAETRTSDLARVLSGRAPEAIALAGALGGADDAVRRWFDELREVKPSITGRDLLAAGLPPGPAIGEALRAALAAKLDGRASTRDEELSAALASWKA